jgi:hypothetical protein
MLFARTCTELLEVSYFSSLLLSVRPSQVYRASLPVCSHPQVQTNVDQSSTSFTKPFGKMRMTSGQHSSLGVLTPCWKGGIAGLNGWDLVPWPCPSFSEWFLTEQWEREFSQVVRRMPCRIKHKVLKAWANSWCTTTRLHESIIWPCIFGCDEKDTLSHYLRCPRLWSSISSVTKTELVFVDPLVKTGLVNPSARMLKHLAIASRVYHTLKFDFHCDVTAAIDCGDFCEIHALLVELVEHYCNEFKVT